MLTSNYARAKQLSAGLVPVSISIKPPYWWRGAHYPPLCPTKEMLTMSPADYDARFDEILSQLDPHQVFAELGENAVLLCYETPNTWCHRRRVAEWLEQSLGIVIPEFGFERVQCLPYAALPEKAPKPARKTRQAKSDSE